MQKKHYSRIIRWFEQIRKPPVSKRLTGGYEGG